MHTQEQLDQSVERPVYSSTQFLERHQQELVSRLEAEALFEKDIASIETFEQIYQLYWHFVAQRIRHVLSNNYSSQLEDLVQETFLKVYRAFQEGKRLPFVAIDSWLARIATNVTIDMLRKQRHIALVSFTVNKRPYGEQDANLVDEIEWLGPDDQESFEQRLATRESIEIALYKMPRTSAICLLYHEYNGFSCAEIAELLHMKVATVRVYLTRARTRFKKLYQYEN
jgi:RNA polymerase sigma-70 factor, ECF subfamily